MERTENLDVVVEMEKALFEEMSMTKEERFYEFGKNNEIRIAAQQLLLKILFFQIFIDPCDFFMI